MYIFLQQALPRLVLHRTQEVEKKGKLRVRFSPTKGKPRCIKRRFRVRVTKIVSRPWCLSQDKNKKFPLLNV